MGLLKYGIDWGNIPEFEVELFCFREGREGVRNWTRRVEDGKTYMLSQSAFEEFPSREMNFKNITKMVLGRKDCKKPFVWNPWNEKMLSACCKYKRVGLCGSGSSTKTYFMAWWGMVNWWASPIDTLVLYTSTGLEESRRRIWGDVEGFFLASCDEKGKVFLPGKLTSSVGKIRTTINGIKHSDKCGLQLIPGDRAKEKDNIGKLIGAKNRRVILMGDEFPELSPALTEAAEGNLMLNPYFQMVVSGNFKSLFDPFGQFVEPLSGWNSITPDCDEWEIDGGVCLRFDGLKSPNVLEGYEKYPGLYKTEHLENHKKLGENSSTFWRMCRSFPCQTSDVDRVWSDADILKGEAASSDVKWKETPIKVASLDPAFVNGGDDAVETLGLWGKSIENKNVLLVTEQNVIFDDVRNKSDNRAVQVCKQFRDNCIKRGIDPKNVAYDGSGGGIVFGGLLSELWSNAPLGVQFGGAASDKPASVKDRRPSKEAFANRVAELWYAGLDFVQSGQLKGLTMAMISELTERRVKDRVKTSSGMKVQIESKKEMKLRTAGKSCDKADSFIILLELCRERLGFTAVGMEGSRLNLPKIQFKKRMLINRVYANVNYAPEQEVAA